MFEHVFNSPGSVYPSRIARSYGNQFYVFNFLETLPSLLMLCKIPSSWQSLNKCWLLLLLFLFLPYYKIIKNFPTGLSFGFFFFSLLNPIDKCRNVHTFYWWTCFFLTFILIFDIDTRVLLGVYVMPRRLRKGQYHEMMS